MHARQFAINLQASGWDILVTPQLDARGETPRVGTTDFSGTNDNKTMLPLNIRQDDLPGLRQTNAEVLTYSCKIGTGDTVWLRNRAGASQRMACYDGSHRDPDPDRCRGLYPRDGQSQPR